MDAELQKELLAVRKMIAKVEPITPSFGIPDGKYMAMPESIIIGKSTGESKRLQATIAWKVIEGEEKDNIQNDYNGIDNEQSVGYFKGKCQVLGIELPKDVMHWQDTFDGWCNNNKDVFDIQVFTNAQGFKNVRILGLSGGDNVGGLGGELEEASVEEVLEEEQPLETAEEATEDIFGGEEGLEELEEEPASAPKATRPVAKPVARTVQKPQARPAQVQRPVARTQTRR